MSTRYLQSFHLHIKGSGSSGMIFRWFSSLWHSKLISLHRRPSSPKAFRYEWKAWKYMCRVQCSQSLLTVKITSQPRHGHSHFVRSTSSLSSVSIATLRLSWSFIIDKWRDTWWPNASIPVHLSVHSLNSQHNSMLFGDCFFRMFVRSI